MKTFTEYFTHFLSTSNKLEIDLRNIDFNGLAISEYSKKYWNDNLRKLKYVMRCNSFLLANACFKSGKQLSEITLIDNGGGTGSISILAKAAGIGNVLYNDIYDVSCDDAKVVASSISLAANDYICGDSDSLVTYFKSRKINCDCIVSRNVIEHIYNLENYFRDIAEYSERNLVVCLATTANIKNPLVNLYTRNIQKTAELKGTKGKWQKERDSNSSFIEIRKKIIKENFEKIEDEKIVLYAQATRGMMVQDIIEFVKNHELTRGVPSLPIDPTNTCDPITGNRTENLLPSSTYKKLLEKNGFEFELKAGFYNVNYAQKVLNLITPCINLVIKKLPFTSIFLAPFILIVGVKNEK